MKRVKKMLGLLVVLFLLFGVLQNKAANAQNEELDEKIYCTATLEDELVVSGSSMRCTDCGYQLGLMK